MAARQKIASIDEKECAVEKEYKQREEALLSQCSKRTQNLERARHDKQQALNKERLDMQRKGWEAQKQSLNKQEHERFVSELNKQIEDQDNEIQKQREMHELEMRKFTRCRKC